MISLDRGRPIGEAALAGGGQRVRSAGASRRAASLTVSIDNEATADGLTSKEEALRGSLLGTHVIIESHDPAAAFISVIDPPDYARNAAGSAGNNAAGRFWLASRSGLGGPRLADHPVRLSRDRRREHRVPVRRHRDRRDPHAAGADDDRRREGRSRATDPKPAEIIERCDAMSAEDLLRLDASTRSATRPGPRDDRARPFAAFNDLTRTPRW